MASVGEWVAGARPRTLPTAVSPVLVGTGAAVGAGAVQPGRALLALVVAVALVIGVNYANDYSDGIRGTDEPDTVRRRWVEGWAHLIGAPVGGLEEADGAAETVATWLGFALDDAGRSAVGSTDPETLRRRGALTARAHFAAGPVEAGQSPASMLRAARKLRARFERASRLPRSVRAWRPGRQHGPRLVARPGISIDAVKLFLDGVLQGRLPARARYEADDDGPHVAHSPLPETSPLSRRPGPAATRCWSVPSCWSSSGVDRGPRTSRRTIGPTSASSARASTIRLTQLSTSTLRSPPLMARARRRLVSAIGPRMSPMTAGATGQP